MGVGGMVERGVRDASSEAYAQTPPWPSSYKPWPCPSPLTLTRPDPNPKPNVKPCPNPKPGLRTDAAARVTVRRALLTLTTLTLTRFTHYSLLTPLTTHYIGTSCSSLVTLRRGQRRRGAGGIQRVY